MTQLAAYRTEPFSSLLLTETHNHVILCCVTVPFSRRSKFLLRRRRCLAAETTPIPHSFTKPLRVREPKTQKILMARLFLSLSLSLSKCTSFFFHPPTTSPIARPGRPHTIRETYVFAQCALGPLVSSLFFFWDVLTGGLVCLLVDKRIVD